MSESEELDLDEGDAPEIAEDPEKVTESGGKLSFLKKKTVMLGLAGIFILAAAGGGYFALSMFSAEPVEQPVAEEVELPEPLPEKTPSFENIFPMDIFENVRLGDKELNRTLTVKIDLEYDRAGGWDELMEKEPGLHDEIGRALKEFTSDVLLHVEGRTALKYKLIKIFNDQLEDISIRNIYFTEFVVRTYKL